MLFFPKTWLRVLFRNILRSLIGFRSTFKYFNSSLLLISLSSGYVQGEVGSDGVPVSAAGSGRLPPHHGCWSHARRGVSRRHIWSTAAETQCQPHSHRLAGRCIVDTSSSYI